MIQYPKQNYVVWDLETSGLDPKNDKILEIGFIVVENGEVKENKSFLLNHGIEISEKTTALTGITKDMIDAQGFEPKQILLHLLDAINEKPHVTHNGLRFDIPFLFELISSPIMAAGNLKDQILKNCIDTAVIYKEMKLMPRMPRRFNETFAEWGNRVLDVRAFGLKYNVKCCCDELGIPVETQHRAGDDVLLTNEIYKKLCLNQ